MRSDNYNVGRLNLQKQRLCSTKADCAEFHMKNVQIMGGMSTNAMKPQGKYPALLNDRELQRVFHEESSHHGWCAPQLESLKRNRDSQNGK